MTVTLYDVTFIDAPGRRLAHAEFVTSTTNRDGIPFELHVDERSITERMRMTISAEIRAADSSRLEPGDWVTTEATPVRPKEIDEGALITVPVQRI